MIGPQIIICWIKGAVRSLRLGARCSGHDYTDAGIHTPPNVAILRCMLCGHRSFIWGFGSVKGPDEP